MTDTSDESHPATDTGTVDPSAIVGYDYADDCGSTTIGANAHIRAGTIIYGDVDIGDDFQTGHNALIREHTTIGDSVVVGTNTTIDGYSQIGSHVSFQTGAYVPSYTAIGSNVFLGPRAVLTNDPYPVRTEHDLTGPTIESDVSIGANATVLPELTVGAGSFVAAGAVVTTDVPPDTLAIGVPARHEPLPERLQGGNNL